MASIAVLLLAGAALATPAAAAARPACAGAVKGLVPVVMRTAHASMLIYTPPDVRRWPGPRPGVL